MLNVPCGLRGKMFKYSRMATTKMLRTAVLSAVLLSADSITAVEFKPAAGGLENQEIQAWKTTTAQPGRTLLKEPQYKYGAPQYLTVSVGDSFDSLICGALDGAQASSNLTLYLDANNNGDLSDDAALNLGKMPGRSGMLQTGPTEVLVKYFTGNERKLRVVVTISARSDKRGNLMYRWEIADHLEALVDLGGGKKVLMGLYDAPGRNLPNGCFGDLGVDHMRIDFNNDGKLDEKEGFLLGKIFGYNQSLWAIQTDSAAFDISISPSSKKACRVQVNTIAAAGGFTGGSIQFAGQDGYFVPCALGKDTVIFVPEGRYSAATRGATGTNAAGQKCSFEFNTPDRITISSTNAAALTFGAPLRVEVNCPGSAKPGQRFSVYSKVFGAGGEEYDNFRCDGRRLAPHVKILKADGAIAAQGNMEFG
jgi:hypothetical protein